MENLIAAFGGFWLASQWSIHVPTLIWVLLGNIFVMAAACVGNNYLDRDLDLKMVRTRHRPIAKGKIKPSHALIYASILGVIGIGCLSMINLLCAILGFVGIFVYVLIYTYWLKRRSTWSTAVGGISGSMPPVIGYVAVTGVIDMGAWLLFAILFLWQPPHFWTLGILRRDEYRNAGFPLLPVVKGVTRTKWQMIPYVVVLIPVSALLYVYEYAGIFYLFTSLILGFVWLWMCITGFWTNDEAKWAKKNFMFSINYLTLLFLVMILNTVKI